MIHSQPLTSKTTLDTTTNDVTMTSASSTVPGTSTGFQKANAKGITYKLFCEVVIWSIKYALSGHIVGIYFDFFSN